MKKILLAAALGLVSLSCYSAGLYGPKECAKVTAAPAAAVKDGSIKEDQHRLACDGSDSAFCRLRIYQVMVEAFQHSDRGPEGYALSWGPSRHHGNLAGITEALPYIKSTGANALWMTPVFESVPLPGQNEQADKLDGTGYFASNYFRVDPKFGTLDDLKRLVDRAHELGIYVILDGVLGHAKSNLVKGLAEHDFAVSKTGLDVTGSPEDGIAANGIFLDPVKSLPFYKDVISYWMKTAKIDGWRFDMAYQVPHDEWKEITSVISETAAGIDYEMNGQKVHPLGFAVGEVYSSDPKWLLADAFEGGALNGAFNFPMRKKLTQVFATYDNNFEKGTCGAPASDLETAGYAGMRIYPETAMPVNFISNHDFLRFGDLLQRARYTNDGEKNFEYFARHRAVWSFLASMSGPLSILYGDESADELPGFVDQPGGCDKINRCNDHVARTDGRISGFTDDEKSFRNYFVSLMRLRDEHPALSSGTRRHVYSDGTLYADLKEQGGDRVLYVLNTSLSDGTLKFEQAAAERIFGKNCSLRPLNFAPEAKGYTLSVPGMTGSFYSVECAAE